MNSVSMNTIALYDKDFDTQKTKLMSLKHVINIESEKCNNIYNNFLNS